MCHFHEIDEIWEGNASMKVILIARGQTNYKGEGANYVSKGRDKSKIDFY